MTEEWLDFNVACRSGQPHDYDIVIDALIEVYSSFISSKIDDYNSSVYYENPNYIFECYKENKML